MEQCWALDPQEYVHVVSVGEIRLSVVKLTLRFGMQFVLNDKHFLNFACFRRPKKPLPSG
jgi:hypothetical protein